jgi:hypothetical protein
MIKGDCFISLRRRRGNIAAAPAQSRAFIIASGAQIKKTDGLSSREIRNDKRNNIKNPKQRLK